MKEIWVKAEPWQKELVTTALESGINAVVVSPDKVSAVKELGIIQTVSDNGDLKWGEDVVSVEVKSAEDEDKIVQQSRDKKVIVQTRDWTIIPLENLIARTENNILVEVETIEEARTALGILEKGVNGLVITQTNPLKVKEMMNELRQEHQTMELVPFTINSVRSLGMGDRVCIDTCSMMGAGEGCLVGNSSQALFLIHAESIENPYVSPRPFRVNAGAVHAYVMVPGGKTRYLSELKAGDEVLWVNSQGQAKSAIIGRVKIEQRPLLLIEASGPNGPATTICQNAETIRLMDKDGQAMSVVKLKPGDEILGYTEEAGRHFGHKIKETITER